MTQMLEAGTAVRSPEAPVARAWKLALLLAVIGSSRWVDSGVEVASAGGIGIGQLILRVLPTLASIVLLVSSFTLLGLSPAERWSTSLRSAPWLGLVAALVVSAMAALLFGRSPFTIWKSVEYLLPVLLGLQVSRLPYAYAAYTFRFMVMAGFLVVSSALVAFVLVPSSALRATEAGIPQIAGRLPFIGPGGLGLLSVASLLVFLNPSMRFRSRHNLAYRAVGVTVSFVALILAQSRTTFVALAILWALTAFSSRSARAGVGRIATFVLGVAVGGIALGAFPVLLTRSGAAGLSTLSNRTLRWQESLRLIEQNPLWGNGLGVAARFENINVTQRRNSSGFGQAHNAYLELALSVGVPATLLVTLGFWVVLFRSRRMLSGAETSYAESPTSARVVAAFLVGGFASTFVVTYSLTLLVLISAFGVLYHELRRQGRT